MRLLLLAAMVLAPGTIAAQAAPTRWAIEVRGPATVERGELRLNGSIGRLLMESADSAYVTVGDLVVDGTHIAFTSPVGNRRFEGVITGAAMSGVVREGDGRAVPWRADVIPAGIDRWPVRPRVVIRQLMIGSSARETVIPAAWRAAIMPRERVSTEYDSLARLAGMSALGGVELAQRAPRVAMGFDRPSRDAARAVLERIAASPAADLEFNRIFRTRTGVRLDLHEVAVAAARARLPEFRLDQAARALAVLRLTAPDATDSLRVYEGAWRLWSRIGRDSVLVRLIVDSLSRADPEGWTSVRALMRGYDDAAEWWTTAVRWLMTNPWMELPDGRRVSPAHLVDTFWNQSKLPLPAIEPRRFGGVQAVPSLGGHRLGTRLVRPANASAAEWLTRDGVPVAIDLWRRIDMVERMTVNAGGRSAELTAPATVDRARLGGFFDARDAIRIEPAIVPIFAVATMVHEWQHLLFEAMRLTGASYGVQDDGIQLRIIEADPWLGEGAAEWATEVTLAPVRGQLPLLAFLEAEKRSGIALASNEDPHVLGYLLVRAVSDRGGPAAGVRDRLVRWLHDPLAFAAESGFTRAGGAPLVLSRPATLAIIPEVTFTWDDGVAEDVQRRLHVPATTIER